LIGKKTELLFSIHTADKGLHKRGFERKRGGGPESAKKEPDRGWESAAPPTGRLRRGEKMGNVPAHKESPSFIVRSLQKKGERTRDSPRKEKKNALKKVMWKRRPTDAFSFLLPVKRPPGTRWKEEGPHVGGKKDRKKVSDRKRNELKDKEPVDRKKGGGGQEFLLL